MSQHNSQYPAHLKLVAGTQHRAASLPTIQPLPAETDPVYADDLSSDPPLSAVLTAPCLFLGYGLLCGAAFFLRLSARAIRRLRRRAEESDRKVTVLGLAVLVALMFAARYGVYAAAAIGGGR